MFRHLYHLILFELIFKPVILCSIYALTECVSLQLPTENQEVWEESVQCLSLLVQLYAGEGHNCLSPSGLQSLSQMLRVHMQAETPRMQRTALKIIKRLVSKTQVHTFTRNVSFSECKQCRMKMMEK